MLGYNAVSRFGLRRSPDIWSLQMSSQRWEVAGGCHGEPWPAFWLSSANCSFDISGVLAPQQGLLLLFSLVLMPYSRQIPSLSLPCLLWLLFVCWHKLELSGKRNLDWEKAWTLLRKELSIRLFVGKSVGHFLDLISAHCMVTVLETLAKKILHSPMGLLTVF